jgi:hypothetical protein
MIQFLRIVCERSSDNKMTSKNIGSIFASGILRPRNEDPVKILDDLPAAASLLAIMVENIELLINIRPEIPISAMADLFEISLHELDRYIGKKKSRML